MFFQGRVLVRNFYRLKQGRNSLYLPPIEESQREEYQHPFLTELDS